MKKTICIIIFIIIASINIISNAVTLEQMQQKPFNKCFGNEESFDLKSNVSDVSDSALTINRVMGILIPVLRNITDIIYMILFIIGIVCIRKKQIKKGIIFIIIAIIMFFGSVMFGLIYHPHHSITP